MAHVCRQVCEGFVRDTSSRKKYCKTCGLFVFTFDLLCACCRQKLRVRNHKRGGAYADGDQKVRAWREVGIAKRRAARDTRRANLLSAIGRLGPMTLVEARECTGSSWPTFREDLRQLGNRVHTFRSSGAVTTMVTVR